MNSPYPNINVVFETSDFKIDITDVNTESIATFSGSRNVTNYEYESQKNDEKRKILVLKKEYLGVFIDDLRNIMRYDQSSQFVDEKTKRV
jgi:hypothetical protein